MSRSVLQRIRLKPLDALLERVDCSVLEVLWKSIIDQVARIHTPDWADAIYFSIRDSRK